MPTVEELYGDFWTEASGLGAELERSLDPRPAESLYEAFGELGVKPGQVVLDVGCRSAAHSIELVRRFGCEVVAVDVVPLLVQQARGNVAKEQLEDRIRVVEAAIESLPIDDAAIDYVWCRDMLNHVDLPRALAECARVIKPEGRMLVYQTFATPELEPREAERLFRAVAIRPENMAPTYFEEQAVSAGLAIVAVDEIDSEWREHWLENGDLRTVDDLLSVARLRRREGELVERFGRERYEAALWDAAWGTYQLLGKLRPTVYVLERPHG